MGLSEIPLFLAKPVVGWMSGWLLATYCPAEGARDSQHLWLVVALTTIAAPLVMVFLRGTLEVKEGAVRAVSPPGPARSG
jgi:membrane-bound acyltransferase YfiQ involved in biofilm formation